MSKEQSKGVQEKGKKGGKIALAVGGAAVIAVGLIVVSYNLGKQDSDRGEGSSVGSSPEVTSVPWASGGGKSTLITDVSDFLQESEEEVGFGFYEVKMTTDWVFDSKTYTVEDGYVANVEANVYDMYFELIEENSGETIYTSPLIKIGEYIDEITLDTPLEPGKYTCKMVHHFFDPSTNQEVDGLNLSIDIEIL